MKFASVKEICAQNGETEVKQESVKLHIYKRLGLFQAKQAFRLVLLAFLIGIFALNFKEDGSDIRRYP